MSALLAHAADESKLSKVKSRVGRDMGGLSAGPRLRLPVSARKVALAAIEVVHRLVAHFAQRSGALNEDFLPTLDAALPDELRAGVRRIRGLDRRADVGAVLAPAADEGLDEPRDEPEPQQPPDRVR